jgi:hypothetical protein
MSDAEEQEDGSTPLSVGARRSGFPHKAIAYANRGATPCDVPPNKNKISNTPSCCCWTCISVTMEAAPLRPFLNPCCVVLIVVVPGYRRTQSWGQLFSLSTGTHVNSRVWTNKLQTLCVPSVRPLARFVSEKTKIQNFCRAVQKMRHRFWHNLLSSLVCALLYSENSLGGPKVTRA